MAIANHHDLLTSRVRPVKGLNRAALGEEVVYGIDDVVGACKGQRPLFFNAIKPLRLALLIVIAVAQDRYIGFNRFLGLIIRIPGKSFPCHLTSL